VILRTTNDAHTEKTEENKGTKKKKQLKLSSPTEVGDDKNLLSVYVKCGFKRKGRKDRDQTHQRGDDPSLCRYR